MIADRYAHFRTLGTDRDFDRRARRRVLHGVVDQVDQDLLELVRVGQHGGDIAARVVDDDAATGPLRSELLEQPGERLLEVQRARLEGDSSGVDT